MNERAENKLDEMLSSPDLYPAPLIEAMAFAYNDAARMCRERAQKWDDPQKSVLLQVADEIECESTRGVK